MRTISVPPSVPRIRRTPGSVGDTPTLATAVYVGDRDEGEELVGIVGRRAGVTGGSFPAEPWQDSVLAAVGPGG